jgi:hypothetical protein
VLREFRAPRQYITGLEIGGDAAAQQHLADWPSVLAASEIIGIFKRAHFSLDTSSSAL